MPPPEPPPPPPVVLPGSGAAAPPPPSPTHRLPGGVIIGGAVAVLLVVAIAGAALGRLFGGGDPSPVPTFPQSGNATPGPTAGATAAPTVGAEPSPTVGSATAAPTVGAEPSPTVGPAPGTQRIEVENLIIDVPTDWTVLHKDPNRIAVSDPGGGLVQLESYQLPLTVELLQEAIVDARKGEYPDTTFCQEPIANPVPGGPPEGLEFVLCYTKTPDGGQASRTVSIHSIGVHQNSVFSYQAEAPASYIRTFAGLVLALTPPNWKLYKP